MRVEVLDDSVVMSSIQRQELLASLLELASRDLRNDEEVANQEA